MPDSKHDALAVSRDTAVKHPVTEELFDLYVNRRLAGWIVDGLIHTPVTANQLTLVAALLGALSGFLIAKGTGASLGWAAVCLLSSMVLDCADGQLARARGGGSRLGRMLDGASDYTNAVALHVGMWAYLAADGVLFRERLVDGWGLFAWVCLAGFSMALHAGLYDHRKQWFLSHTRPDLAEDEDPEEMRRDLANASNVVERLLMRYYIFYTQVQRHLSHSEETPRVYLEDTAARHGFIRRAVPFFRLAGFVGPTSHNVLILLACVAATFYPESFWWYVLTVCVPMNLVFVFLVFWGRRLEAQIGQA